LGLVIAWVILAFIGPRPQVSYYVQAPVSPTPLSDLDKIMEAVGLASSASPAPAPAPVSVSVAIMTPPQSVADVAMGAPAPAPQSELPVDQGTPSTPPPGAPE